jgi:SAM-dependent methyltransferase
MDLSNLVFSARQTLQDRPNISLVKGDVFRMPFKSDFFDFIYSVGALHHLPEPERSFQSLLQHTKPGGSVIIWVYSKDRRLMTRVVEAFRFVAASVFHPQEALFPLCLCRLFHLRPAFLSSSHQSPSQDTNRGEGGAAGQTPHSSLRPVPFLGELRRLV